MTEDDWSEVERIGQGVVLWTVVGTIIWVGVALIFVQ